MKGRTLKHTTVNPEENTLNSPRYTYRELRKFLDEHGMPGDSAHGEGRMAELPAIGVTVHDHPHSGSGRELHVMLNGMKVAEIGPADNSDLRPGEHDDNVPGYVDFLAEWTGKPTMGEGYGRLKLKIAQDNGLVPDETSARERATLEFMDGHDGFNSGPQGNFHAGWDAAVAFMTR